ncbi:TIGR00730 family Rossman fold protein [Caulobacter sp. SLTY]|uniref:LOG family protein n=1 Tax=Caulobacter sp. SLTY TaxID=2683262 RepID=UPI0014122433|nr:TIGR00730 family Rossman fold protein [Caulobacter sp. SLTY]NBB14998.1 TIGR00730 family Rossman fold protein [Caulobacter sp. SLTY]
MAEQEAARIDSVCVYCGSSNDADPAFLESAEAFGGLLAKENLRLIYGGGGVGLMGACARGAHDAGGRVLGIIPTFLMGREQPFDDVETIVVQNMHERKMMMFEEADSFVVLPGGIGTLEEVIELLSWQRLDLHKKPLVFYNPRGFWEPLFDLLHHTITERLSPPEFAKAWRSTDDIGQVTALLREMAAAPGAGTAHPATNELT